MTYEEEVKQAISKASKKLRGKVKTIVELNSESGMTGQRKKIDDIYDSVVGEEIEYFNALLIAMNGIIRRKDSFYLLYSQIYESYDKVVNMLKSVRSLEDKAALLNGIAKYSEDEAAKLFKRIKYEDGICMIEKTPSGMYIVKSIKFKDFMRSEKREYNKYLAEFKTLYLCLEDYTNTYGIADMIPNEITELNDEMKEGLFIPPELEEVYSRYASVGGGIFAKRNGTIADILNEGEEETHKFTPFNTYEESKVEMNKIKINMFKL